MHRQKSQACNERDMTVLPLHRTTLIENNNMITPQNLGPDHDT
jgi:hypothetical protein